MNDKGQSPWLAVSGDFFNSRAVLFDINADSAA
jgi:hypothetical protein